MVMTFKHRFFRVRKIRQLLTHCKTNRLARKSLLLVIYSQFSYPFSLYVLLLKSAPFGKINHVNVANSKWSKIFF